MQGKGGIYYAGAWCGYGFHEDGLKAGMTAAIALGAAIPWTPIATSPKMSLADMFFMSTFDKFARRAISLGRLRFILPNGEELVYGDAASAARSLPAGCSSCQSHIHMSPGSHLIHESSLPCLSGSMVSTLW